MGMKKPTVKKLKKYCRDNKIKGYSRLNKSDLIELISNSISNAKSDTLAFKYIEIEYTNCNECSDSQKPDEEGNWCEYINCSPSKAWFKAMEFIYENCYI